MVSVDGVAMTRRPGNVAKKKDPLAVALGRRGGKARATRLSREALSEIGKKGAQVRWAKRRQNGAVERA